MTRKELILFILVCGSIIVPQLHIIMNDWPAYETDLILFLNVGQDIQWYVKDMGDNISFLFLFVIIRRLLPLKLKYVGSLLIIGLLIDLVNYWLFFHQYDWIYKSIIIITIPIIFYIRYEKRNNTRPSA